MGRERQRPHNDQQQLQESTVRSRKNRILAQERFETGENLIPASSECTEVVMENFFWRRFIRCFSQRPRNERFVVHSTM